MSIHQENQTMQILSPLKEAKEVLPLSQEGADAFYCGLVDEFGALNDRPNTEEFNFTSMKDLQQAVAIAHEHKKAVFLVVNHLSPNFQRALYQVDIARQLKMDGVILANFLLMEKVKALKSSLQIHASCLTATFNSMTAQFLKECGAGHIHLPRHLGITEVTELIAGAVDVSFGVFAVSGMCINIEAFCSLHGLSTKECFPCLHFRACDVQKNQTINRYECEEKMNSPQEACALCALPALQKAGIQTLKIEGREESLQGKIQHVRMLKQGLMLMDQKRNAQQYIKECRQLFQHTYKMACQDKYCFF